MPSIDKEIAKTQEERKKSEQKLGSLATVIYDIDLYGSSQRDNYLHSIPVDDEEIPVASKLPSYTAPKYLLKETPGVDGDVSDGFRKPQRITDRENSYQKRRLNRAISPDRNDPFVMGDKTPDPNKRTYADIMREVDLKRQREETVRAISKKKKGEELQKRITSEVKCQGQSQPTQKRGNRWDQSHNKQVHRGAVKIN